MDTAGKSKERVVPWRPLNTHHSIELARVSVAFSEGVPEKLLRATLASFESKREELGFAPGTMLGGTTFTFQIGPSGSIPTAQSGPVTGWQSLRQAVNGRTLESLELNGAELSYQAAEYDRWTSFAERLKSVLGEIPYKLATVLSRRVTILEYVDRFFYEGETVDADAREILSDVALHIPKHAASGESLWHIHRGWFQNDDGKNILVNINFGTDDGSIDGVTIVRGLQTTTRVELRHAKDETEFDTLFADLDFLHRIAKDTFSNSISQSARIMVGLETKL